MVPGTWWDERRLTNVGIAEHRDGRDLGNASELPSHDSEPFHHCDRRGGIFGEIRVSCTSRVMSNSIRLSRHEPGHQTLRKTSSSATHFLVDLRAGCTAHRVYLAHVLHAHNLHVHNVLQREPPRCCVIILYLRR